MDIGISKIRQEPKVIIAYDLTKQKIKHSDDYSHGGLSNDSIELTTQKMKHNDYNSHRGLSNGLSEISTIMRIVGFRNILLLIATLFATITFQVTFSPPWKHFQRGLYTRFNHVLLAHVVEFHGVHCIGGHYYIPSA
ncbi:hypothetical protein LOK49_LG01G01608 [Camellia lanceoleosa]|uniref:Uncharacterized protein n=1 Tax=Camellia lanceoleosa TaxID=1840588 RepID=A0ACC0IZD2_9ERIC|nr:hypothetical protein LOK49_LG01G01608 [Camellia lanceoleosa]